MDVFLESAYKVTSYSWLWKVATNATFFQHMPIFRNHKETMQIEVSLF